MLVGSVCTRLSSHVSLSGSSSAMAVAAPTLHSTSSSSVVAGTAGDFSQQSDCCRSQARKRIGIARNLHVSSRRSACTHEFCSPIRLPPARQPLTDTCQHLQTCLLSHTQHSCADLPTIWHAVRPFHSPLTDTVHLSGYRILPPVVTSPASSVATPSRSTAAPSGADLGLVSSGSRGIGDELHATCGRKGICSSSNCGVFARDGSWNAAWDARPARWLQSQHSTWLLFGVCSCAVVAAAFSDTSGIQSADCRDVEQLASSQSPGPPTSSSSPADDVLSAGKISTPPPVSDSPLSHSSSLSSSTPSLQSLEHSSNQGTEPSLRSASAPTLVLPVPVAEKDLPSSPLPSSPSSLSSSLPGVGSVQSSGASKPALLAVSTSPSSRSPLGLSALAKSTLSNFVSPNFTAACERVQEEQRSGGISRPRAAPRNDVSTTDGPDSVDAATPVPAADHVSGKKVHRDLCVTAIPGDGRCLFRAVAHGACLRDGRLAPTESQQRELADELRNKVVDELVKKRSEVEWFIEGDFDTYVSNMRKPHTWGGEPELLMSSHVLRMPITVFIPDAKSGGMISIAEYGQEYSKDNPIMVLFNGVGHYDVLQKPLVKNTKYMSPPSKI
ncbi:hypothetical protein CBR_g16890 [Chara braunii]|uniref:Ubiquitin thioesterase OTU n=1 Tax=Chara braunii TaxID=69332 RepID=A0A388KU18_CHABU|nr:hypothetical protein CBR_g16890 [Chara braunii]|eukprot:GBG73547.1 hypothetical protein CBR_g16890 [Chara braunii]